MTQPIIPVIVGKIVECVQCHKQMVVYPYPEWEGHPGFVHPECQPAWRKEHDQ